MLVKGAHETLDFLVDLLEFLHLYEMSAACNHSLSGVLHMLGYDHIDDGDAAIMEKLEIEALARLGMGNPYEKNANNL